MKELIKLALNTSEKAYAPYSNFKVGAVCVTKNKNLYTGCNIENASYSLCCCAERTAIFNAVSKGEKDIEIIVVANKTKLPYPCGACLQVMAEFNLDMKVIVAKSEDEYKIFSLRELLPNSFKLN